MWQGGGEVRIPEGPEAQDPPAPRSPPDPTPKLESETPGFPSPQPPTGGPHRQVHKAQGGDNATDEADDEGAVWHEHHFSRGAHGHPSRKRGVLDVHLGTEGRSSVLPQSLHGSLWAGAGRLALGSTGDSQRVSASREPAEDPGPSSCALCTSGLATVHGHTPCVCAGETY